MLRPIIKRVLGHIPVALVLAVFPQAVQAQAGQVTGTVIDATTNGPLTTVQVFLQGTSHGALTGEGGRFTLTDIDPGQYTLVAQRIGYQEARTEVTVTAGGTATANVSLDPAVLSLQAVVATGLIDPVEGVRSPITIGRVDRELMPVLASGSVIQNLQGRIPGVTVNRGSGQPGTGTTMMLRTPTSVVADNTPLIVVDGVILGEDNTTNIESLDIESMEVVKGAAAASLYGSRAAAGVIAITTNRGRGLDIGQTRFTARTEMGITEPARSLDLPTHHHYIVDNPSAPTGYLDADGNPVDRENRVVDLFRPGIAFMDTPYPGAVFDNQGNIFQPGNFMTHSFSVAQNAEATNFALSLNRRVEQGALENNNGYSLNSFRLNLDHRFRETLSLGISAYHSRDDRDNLANALIFSDLLSAPPDIDLSARDENGEYVRVLPSDVTYNNPVWEEGAQDDDQKSVRTLANANLRWTPMPWITGMANLSYDRQDQENREYVALGTPISEQLELGRISFDNEIDDVWNGDAQVSLRRDIGALNMRTTIRGIAEVDRSFDRVATGTEFFVGNVPDISAAAVEEASSEESEVKSLGYLWDTAFDYAGKYIFTGMVRRDGSSLFGPDNRWHNYYRVAGSYRIAEEPWFNVPNVNEFKLSYARGTAGGRPGFTAQFETWTVNENGLFKETLGNRDLRPEHTTEQEVSLDVILFNRFSIDLTHAWQRTEEQLVFANLPSITGFSQQWSNGGTVTGNTLELAIEADLYRTENVGWSATLVADRSQGKIEEWPFACENPSWRYRCDGVGIYEIWGGHFLRSPSELAVHHGGALADHADEFQVNDDGYLVWVGEGNSYTEGISKELWGTSTNIGGQVYEWGMPFLELDEASSLERQQIGDAAHVNLGWLNNVRYRGFTFHTHLHASVGGDAMNSGFWGLVGDLRSPVMDQAGKTDETKKPTAYYEALEGGTGNDAWLEDGDYVKLRTVSVNYRADRDLLNRFGLGSLGLESLSLGLVGRNLFTITDFTGFDPEQALNLSSRSAAAGLGYPSTRNYTAEVQVTF